LPYRQGYGTKINDMGDRKMVRRILIACLTFGSLILMAQPDAARAALSCEYGGCVDVISVRTLVFGAHPVPAAEVGLLTSIWSPANPDCPPEDCYIGVAIRMFDTSDGTPIAPNEDPAQGARLDVDGTTLLVEFENGKGVFLSLAPVSSVGKVVGITMELFYINGILDKTTAKSMEVRATLQRAETSGLLTGIEVRDAFLD
jgi:hypothetical protein